MSIDPETGGIVKARTKAVNEVAILRSGSVTVQGVEQLEILNQAIIGKITQAF